MTWLDILALDDAALNRALDAALGVVWAPSTFHKVEQYYERYEDRRDERGNTWKERLLSLCDYTEYTAHWERTMTLALSWGVTQEYYPYGGYWHIQARWHDRIIRVSENDEPQAHRTAICRAALWAMQQQGGRENA